MGRVWLLHFLIFVRKSASIWIFPADFTIMSRSLLTHFEKQQRNFLFGLNSNWFKVLDFKRATRIQMDEQSFREPLSQMIWAHRIDFNEEENAIICGEVLVPRHIFKYIARLGGLQQGSCISKGYVHNCGSKTVSIGPFGTLNVCLFSRNPSRKKTS